MLTDLQKLALEALKVYERTVDAVDTLERQVRKSYHPEFYLPVMAVEISEKFIEMVDFILEPASAKNGDGLASYYLWDCGRDGKIINQGAEYPIKSVDDLGVYVSKINERNK